MRDGVRHVKSAFNHIWVLHELPFFLKAKICHAFIIHFQVSAECEKTPIRKVDSKVNAALRSKREDWSDRFQKQTEMQPTNAIGKCNKDSWFNRPVNTNRPVAETPFRKPHQNERMKDDLIHFRNESLCGGISTGESVGFSCRVSFD